MCVINGKLRTNTSLPGAGFCCGVHARACARSLMQHMGAHIYERFKPLLFTRHRGGFDILGVVVEETGELT
jgi:hypothetical protein